MLTDDEFRVRFGAPTPGICQETDCSLPKVKPKHRCSWHLEAAMPPDQRAAEALKRRQAWDGQRTRADGSCAGCGVPDVPEWYRTGARCRSCGILDRRRTGWNLTDDQQSRLLTLQGGSCAGCNRAQRICSLAVDHDHYSGEVRGYLCVECNTTVGGFYNDPRRFLRLALYLIAPTATQVGIGEAMSRKQLLSELVPMVEQILNERKLA